MLSFFLSNVFCRHAGHRLNNYRKCLVRREQGAGMKRSIYVFTVGSIRCVPLACSNLLNVFFTCLEHWSIYCKITVDGT